MSKTLSWSYCQQHPMTHLTLLILETSESLHFSYSSAHLDPTVTIHKKGKWHHVYFNLKISV